jgi:hypothetical protein
MTSGAWSIAPPATRASAWWPRQTPSTGTSARWSACSEIPTSRSCSGRPGPGEITMLSTGSAASSSQVSSSLRATIGSRPLTSPSRWKRLNVNES